MNQFCVQVRRQEAGIKNSPEINFYTQEFLIFILHCLHTLLPTYEGQANNWNSFHLFQQKKFF